MFGSMGLVDSADSVCRISGFGVASLRAQRKRIVGSVTGSARARLPHGLKLDDLELSCPVLYWRERQHSVSLPDPFPDTKRLELHEVQPPAAARATEICR